MHILIFQCLAMQSHCMHLASCISFPRRLVGFVSLQRKRKHLRRSPFPPSSTQGEAQEQSHAPAQAGWCHIHLPAPEAMGSSTDKTEMSNYQISFSVAYKFTKD